MLPPWRQPVERPLGDLLAGLQRGTVALAVGLASLALLLAGSDPRRATRWAWFWLASCLPVAVLGFLLLEPLPLWRRTATVRSHPALTGGKALLLGLVLAAVGRHWLPELTGLLWSGQRG